MKNIFLIIAFLLNLTIYSQEDKTVSLTVTGTGKTLEQAKNNALRLAIEQAFGAFISTKTEILNDNLISDQIVSLANGNIQSFNILEEFQLLDNNWSLTLKAVVSVNKLISFVESKGITVEIKGGLFALNIKQQMLNEENEVKSILNLTAILFDFMQNSFDYNLKVEEPISIDGDNQKWNLPMTVSTIANKNMDVLNEYCLNTLKNISLSQEEINNYVTLNKKTFKLIFKKNSEENTFYFRKEISTEILRALFYTEYNFLENFLIDLGNIKLTNYQTSSTNLNHKYNLINLFSNLTSLGIFNYNYATTLSGIESTSNISVVPYKKRYVFNIPSNTKTDDIASNVSNDFFKDNLVHEFSGTIFKSNELNEIPKYPGGLEKFYSFVGKNYQMPEEGLMGIVSVFFVVEIDGSLSNIKVLRDIGYGTGKEAIRVLKASPRWNPGVKNGEKVRSNFSLPIRVQSAE